MAIFHYVWKLKGSWLTLEEAEGTCTVNSVIHPSNICCGTNIFICTWRGL